MTEATKSIMSFCLLVYLFVGLFVLHRNLLDHFLAYPVLNNAHTTATRQDANFAIQHPVSEVILNTSQI